MKSIFISYSSKLKSKVSTLAAQLDGIHDVWLDQELTGGQAWWCQILAKIRECDVFVYALAPETINSTACTLEYRYAVDLGKTILPIIMDNGVSTKLLPPALSEIHCLDFRGQDREAAFELIRAIKRLPSPGPLPKPLPEEPQVPISYLGDVKQRLDSSRPLGLESQSAIILQLESGMRNLDDHPEIRDLLERFRGRHDLFAAVAERIDKLLGELRTDRVRTGKQARSKAARQPEAVNPDTVREKSTRTSDIARNFEIDQGLDDLREIVDRVIGKSESWTLEVDPLNRVELTAETAADKRHLSANAFCRESFTDADAKQKGLKTLGWKTKDKGWQVGMGAGAALAFTSGVGFAVLLSKKVRDYVMAVNGHCQWPVKPDANTAKIAAQLLPAIKVIAADQTMLIATRQG